MSESRLFNDGSRAHFLTRRFDRDKNGERVHQQSLCAMDHLDFRLKDTHSYSQYFGVIRSLGMSRDVLAEGFRRMVFNVVAMNRDDHTKNFAFQLPKNGTWGISPAFDVTHSFNPQGRWTQRHQLSVNSKFDGIARADLESVGDTFGVPGYRAIIDTVAEVVQEWPNFARNAGVSEQSITKIAKDFAEHKI